MTFRLDWTLGKKIVRLAYPVTVAMLTQTAINLVDTIMVGRLPSDYSIAGQSAIAISLILLWAFGGMISSISVGTQALTARRYGEGARKAAGKVLNNAAFIALMLSIVATVAVLATLRDFYPYLHSNPSVVTFGVDYCSYRFIGVSCMVLTIVYKGFFDGVGRTKVHMVAALGMNLANVILNWVLIFGVGPFPQMYVAGAGLASLIATCIGLVIMLTFSSMGSTRREFGLYARGSLDLRVCWDVIRIGIPGGLATLFVMIGFGAFITIVGWLDMDQLRETVYGLPQYAALDVNVFGQAAAVWTPELHQVVLRDNPPVFTSSTKVIMDIMSVVFMTCMAWGQATATLVGQSLGAGKPDLAERYGWESAKLGAYFMFGVGLLIFLFPDAISSIFNPDASVINASHDPLRLMAFSASLIAVGMILAQSLFGAGITVFVAVAEMVLHFGCLIPVAYLLGVTLDLGLVGIWGSVVTYIVLLAAVMAWKFRQGSWKYNEI